MNQPAELADVVLSCLARSVVCVRCRACLRYRYQRVIAIARVSVATQSDIVYREMLKQDPHRDVRDEFYYSKRILARERISLNVAMSELQSKCFPLKNEKQRTKMGEARTTNDFRLL